MVSFPGLVLIVTGSFFIWMFKGFKGKFDDHMVRIEDRFSLNGWIRFGVGILFWSICLISVSQLLRPPKQDTIYYEVVPDGKGGFKLK